MPEPTSFMRVLRVLRWVYLVGVLGFVVFVLPGRLAELRSLTRGAKPVLLVLAGSLLMLQVGTGSLVWRTGLAALGERVRFSSVLEAVSRSLPARYLPGGIWYSVSRAVLLHRRGAARRAVATLAVLEALVGLMVALVLGSALLVVTGRLGVRPGLLVILGGCAALVFAPRLVNLALSGVARIRRGGLDAMDTAGYARFLGSLLVFWSVAACAFASYLSAFPRLGVGSPVEVAGAFLIAWSAGFVAVIAPQGAGVFELSLAALLVGDRLGTVALVAAGYRGLVLLRDVVAAGVGEVLARRRALPPRVRASRWRRRQRWGRW